MNLKQFLLSVALLGLVSHNYSHAKSACDYSAPTSKTIRPNKTIRLGGYFYTGKLDALWYASNYDLLDLNAKNDRQTIARLKDINPNLRVFQQFLANQIAIKQTGAQAAEGYELKKMESWLLKDDSGIPAHPRGPYYLMMNISADSGWTEYFSSYAKNVILNTDADGIVLDEIPLRKTGMFSNFKKYPNDESWQDDTIRFLSQFRSTVKVPVLINAGELSSVTRDGRVLWESFSKEIDGAWHEGWIRFYGAHQSPHEGSNWEWDIRSAEKFSAAGKPYIASAAFRDRTELEYALANYLLAIRGKSLVFQPMVAYDQKTRGGFNFEIAQKAVIDNQDLFDIELGCALGKRQKFGQLWIREYSKGLVIVNPNIRATVTPSTISGHYLDTSGKRLTLPIQLDGFEGRILRNSE